MNYSVYIIQSLKNNHYYIGSTENLERRLTEHNGGLSRWTKRATPWKLIYRETFEDRASAVRRERQIKSYKGGDAFKKLVNL